MTWKINGQRWARGSLVPPWTESVSLPPRAGTDTWSLDVVRASGTIEVRVLVDGTVVVTATASAAGGSASTAAIGTVSVSASSKGNDSHFEGTVG